MPGKISILKRGAFALAVSGISAATAESRPSIVFTGDILLARNVAREIDARTEDPWSAFSNWLKRNAQVVGNLEGAVGDTRRCGNTAIPCFVVDAPKIELLKNAGFTALGLENNHSADAGPDSRIASRQALERKGLAGLTYDSSPWFLRFGTTVIGLVTYNEIPAPAAPAVTPPEIGLAQKIRLAHQLSNLTVVFVHWGTELQDWPSATQHDHARWLIQQGADLVIGHHPHVVQGSECVDGRPVLYSLGNHVFDQKYPATKTGQILQCALETGALACVPWHTSIPIGSAFPSPPRVELHQNDFWKACPPKLRLPQSAGGITLSAMAGQSFEPREALAIRLGEGSKEMSFPAPHLISLQSVKFGNDGQQLLLALQSYYSTLDRETGPRPYVYAVGPHGFIAKWRGSALAWPLVDVTTITSEGIDYLCALHRGDSFLVPNPSTPLRRTQVYEWNGFGFSGATGDTLKNKCDDFYRAYFTADPQEQPDPD